jgi:hypothetical protein
MMRKWYHVFGITLTSLISQVEVPLGKAKNPHESETFIYYQSIGNKRAFSKVKITPTYLEELLAIKTFDI